MNKPSVYLLTAILAFGPTLAMAQSQPIAYTGPTKITPVHEILNEINIFTDQDVMMEGKLIKQLSADTFVFSDGKDEITVELDDDTRLGQTIDAETRVRVYGEVDGGLQPEIEIDRIQVL
ncbi:NirD/YgiW/YdeI family stress tolerance protein [Photobacterium japonica]|uniref:YgiW/YdeI family stress tolerance OB fold protein n=1 Tax=Photobacterium japonica TaxID=2910235 RepID=UPI003D109380